MIIRALWHRWGSNMIVYGDMEIEVSEEIEIEEAKDFYSEELSSKELKQSIPMKIFTKQDIYTPFDVTVEILVKNNGNDHSEDTLFVYIRDLECSLGCMECERKGIENISLKAGESKRVMFYLSYDCFGFYNEEMECFIAEAGEFEIVLKTSLGQIIEVAVIELERGYYYR